jgi:protein-disulfide isomerase
MGVTGTPSIFVNGKWVEGGYAYETIKAAVDAALAGQ